MLTRELTPLNAFGVTFCCVGVLWVFSRDPLLHALTHGGPAVAVWGWVGGSCLSGVTALCLAEMAACMPAAVGSLYVFTARLAPWHSRALATWVAAWANLAAAAGSTAYYALVTTRTLAAAARLSRIAAAGVPYDPAQPGYSLSPAQLFATYCCVLLSWAALGAAPLRVTAGLITGASLWQVLGGGALFGSLLALSPTRQSASFVLAGWRPSYRTYGIGSAPYNVVEGLLFPISALTGYETVLYFVEEMLLQRRQRRRGRLRDGGAAAAALAAAAPSATRSRGRPGQPGSKGKQGQRGKEQQRPQAAPRSGLSGATASGSTSGGGDGGGGFEAPPELPTAAGRSAAAAVSGSPLPGSDTARTAAPPSATAAAVADAFGPAAAADALAAAAPPAGPWGVVPDAGWATLYQQQRQVAAVGGAAIDGGGGGGSWQSTSALCPASIYGGLVASCALTLMFLLLLLAAAPSLPHAVDPGNETLGEDPMAQIVYDILRAAYGSGRGAPGLIAVLAVGSYGTGLVAAAGTARKLWAMAADGFVAPCFGAVSPASGVPVHAAATVTAAALLPGLLLFADGGGRSGGGAGAAAGGACLSAFLSFYVVAANASFLLPLVLRLLPGSGGAGYDAGARRVRAGGGFTLGRASRPLFALAAAWTALSMLLALLPPAWPPAPARTANWAPISSAALAACIAASWWAPRLGARRWFRGLASVGGVTFC